MKWRRITMAIGIITMAFFLSAFFTPLINVMSRPLAMSSELAPADAIVVLGSGLLRDGSLTYESMRRLMFGLRLYKEGLAPTLIVSGPPRDHTAPESTVRARIAVELGIPESAVFEISAVNTTREEAMATAAILAPRQAKHILLITQSLHMRRATRVFEAAGLTVSPAPSDNAPYTAASPEERMLLLQDLALQSAGLVYYHVAGFIR